MVARLGEEVLLLVEDLHVVVLLFEVGNTVRRNQEVGPVLEDPADQEEHLVLGDPVGQEGCPDLEDLVDLEERPVDQEEGLVLDRIEFVAEDDIAAALVEDRADCLEADHTVEEGIHSLLVAEEDVPTCCNLLVAGFVDHCFQTVNSHQFWLVPKYP